MSASSPLSGKSVLITGATGLIGRALLQRIAPLCGTVHAPSHDDLRGPAAWHWLPKSDYIIHAAGYAAPGRFLKHQTDTIFLGTTALMVLLDKLNPEGRLLFLSSSELYTGCPRVAYEETDIGNTTPQHARSVYIEAKRCGEAICHAARLAGKQAIAARVSLAYGPGVKNGDERAMSQFIESALVNRHIELCDGGSARRCYCYVEDAAGMLMNILTRGRHGVYNVGGQSEISIHGLARRIGELTRAVVKAPHGRERPIEGAPAHVKLDMTRYISEFGNPHYTEFSDGLKRTVEWHRAQLALSGAIA